MLTIPKRSADQTLENHQQAIMKLTMAIGFILYLQAADAGRHQSAGRVRNINAANPWKALQNQGDSASLISALQKQAQELEEEEASILELVQALEAASGLSVAPTVSTTGSPTLASVPSVSPSLSVQPSNGPSPAGIVFDTENPTISAAPSALPTISPTISAAPSNNPTLAGCGTTPEEREAAIFGILDQVADSSLIRDITTPQGQAARWIISEDELRLCPNDLKIVQRWVLAVMYFSTGGDSWTQCFQDDVECGVFLPFLNQEAFLSPSTECEWAGIACDAMACVTEIEFEENNLVGTIPTELGLLDELVCGRTSVQRIFCFLVIPLTDSFNYLCITRWSGGWNVAISQVPSRLR